MNKINSKHSDTLCDCALSSRIETGPMASTTLMVTINWKTGYYLSTFIDYLMPK